MVSKLMHKSFTLLAQQIEGYFGCTKVSFQMFFLKNTVFSTQHYVNVLLLRDPTEQSKTAARVQVKAELRFVERNDL